jgi:hypothetical protein
MTLLTLLPAINAPSAFAWNLDFQRGPEKWNTNLEHEVSKGLEGKYIRKREWRGARKIGHGLARISTDPNSAEQSTNQENDP